MNPSIRNDASASRGIVTPNWLVADIGGTNARFALAQPTSTQAPHERPALSYARALRVDDHDTLHDAITQFLGDVPQDSKPKHAVLAVASAVTEDNVRFTNSHWSFSINALKRMLELDTLLVVNDFAAAARAVTTLTAADFQRVGSCFGVDSGAPGMRVVLGPGTGLGLAALHRDGDGQVRVFETEAGHIGFAARDDDEQFILNHLSQRFGRISYERVLGGEGWLNLYQAWSARLKIEATLQTPEEVSAAAQQGDPAAMAATRSMASILGAFAGDAVLMYGAWQGVYLAGGLLSHLFNRETSELFRQSFEDKGRFAGMLKKTPVLHIVHPDLGNFGAAAMAADWLRRRGSVR